MSSGSKGMNLGLAHDMGLTLALTVSVLMVLLGGEFPPWMWLTAFAPVLSMALARRDIRVPGIAGTVMGLAAIGAGMMSIARGGLDNAVFAGGASLLGLLVARTLTRQTLAHDQQALLMSLILVFAGSVLNVGISYFVFFVAYAIAGVWALATRQLLSGVESAGGSVRRTREREDVITPLFFAASAGVSLAVLAAALIVFVSFPRVGLGELNFLGRRGDQLPERVGLGGNPRGGSTSTVQVARVTGVPLEAFVKGLYLRSNVYDVVTLDEFAQSPPGKNAPVVDRRSALPTMSEPQTNFREYRVALSPVAGTNVMVLGQTRVASTESGGTHNPNGSLPVAGRDAFEQIRTHSPIASVLRYRVIGRANSPGELPPEREANDEAVLSDADRERYLKVPALDAQLERLASAMVAPDQLVAPSAGWEADMDVRIARTIRGSLLRDYDYTLEGVVAGRSQPLRAFLLDAKAGHCELFASAYALLLRKQGIPARVIGGFQGGALADADDIVFQMRHAHAWVEWWKDDVGWIVDDATPEASEERERYQPWRILLDAVSKFWDDEVLDYSLEEQSSALRGIRKALRGKHLGTLLRATLVAVPVLGVLLWLRGRLRRRKDARRDGDLLATEMVRAIARISGSTPPSSSTLRELVERWPRPSLRDALLHYEAARFGGLPLDADLRRRLIKGLRRLRASSPAAKGA